MFTQISLFPLDDGYLKIIQYHKENAHIYEAFKKYTFELINAGRHNLGARNIVERIRWDTLIRSNTDDGFKINNNICAFYARLFINDFPTCNKAFKLRESKFDELDFENF